LLLFYRHAAMTAASMAKTSGVLESYRAHQPFATLPVRARASEDVRSGLAPEGDCKMRALA
jgi:hypothetical protein